MTSDTNTDPAKNLTTTRQRHWCADAHHKNPQQVAPDQSCIERGGPIPCETETFTVRSVRRFKSHPGEVRVTWSGGFSTWENDPRVSARKLADALASIWRDPSEAFYAAQALTPDSWTVAARLADITPPSDDTIALTVELLREVADATQDGTDR